MSEEKQSKVYLITENQVRKGGVNKPPTTPRPKIKIFPQNSLPEKQTSDR